MAKWTIPDMLTRAEADRQTREAVAAALKRAADWCARYSMATVTDARKAQYAGCYVSEEEPEIDGMRHHGMGYAEAILALIPDERN